MAIAIGGVPARSLLFNALRRSTAPEGKLFLNRFLRAKGGSLAAAVGEGWSDRLLQGPALEVYLPVQSHRGSWSGDETVLVLPVTGTDDEARQRGFWVAYDTKGRAVHLSIHEAPGTPVLSIVQVEDSTEFGADGESTSVGAPMAIPGDSTPPPTNTCRGIRPGEDKIQICDVLISGVTNYEGWPRGAPEVVFKVQLLNTATGALTDFSPQACINESQASPRYYNQDSDTWRGNVLLIGDALLKSSTTSTVKPVITAWEDDNGSQCDFQPEQTDSSLAVVTMASGFMIAVGGVVPAVLPAWTVVVGVLTLGVGINLNLNGDDYIGQVGLAPGDGAIMPKIIYRPDYPGGPLIQRGVVKFETQP